MMNRRSLSMLAAVALALFMAAPATAAPSPGASADRPALDSELPTDRPVIATVVDIDEAGGTVLLSTPHGRVALAVPPELAGKLSVGDVLVVRFTDESDFPSASPPTEEREKI
jgi:hypothetical protein